MTNKCIICTHTETGPLYSGVKKCLDCGHVFADTRLDKKEFYDLYRKNYFFGEEYKDYPKDKNIIQKNFRLRLKVLERFLEPRRHQRLLEIGCAYGFFLELIRDRFAYSLGIDISEDAIKHADSVLKLNAARGDFLDDDLGDGYFDVVCLWDTIEHLESPHLYLEKAGVHMKSGALLALTTGDIESFNARWKKEKWRLMHPPTHVHYFSKRTIAKILDKNGFDVIYERYCGFYRSLDLFFYSILVLNNRWPGLYNTLSRMNLGRFYFYSNLYDIMYIIARKR